MPAGESPSTNEAFDVPEAPQVPAEPSTCRQSDALPLTPSMDPRELMKATRLVAKAAPSSGRAARSAVKPVTWDSLMGPVVISPPPVIAAAVAELTRTALTRTGCVLAGTDHVSWNCTRPSLL